MYSYPSKHNAHSISQPMIRKKNDCPRYPSKESPQPDLNYYEGRRMNMDKLAPFTAIRNRPTNSNCTEQRYSTPVRSDHNARYSPNTERKCHLNNNNPFIYLSHSNLFKKESSATTAKPKYAVGEEALQLQEENAYLKRENLRLKEEIESIERSSNQITQENKKELEGMRMNLYEQLEQSRNEIKVFERNKENLNAQILRYKKEIQKLIEDNIKLKSINQEQSLLINSSNASFTSHGYVINKEISFAIVNGNNNSISREDKLHINNTSAPPLQSENDITTHSSNECSQTEMVISAIEKENDALSEAIMKLESKVDCYLLSSLTEEPKNSNNNNNNSMNSDINGLLFSFYSKIASLLNKSIIDYASLPFNKKMFSISTSSIITEIKTYQLMLQKTSFHSYFRK